LEAIVVLIIIYGAYRLFSKDKNSSKSTTRERIVKGKIHKGNSFSSLKTDGPLTSEEQNRVNESNKIGRQNSCSHDFQSFKIDDPRHRVLFKMICRKCGYKKEV
jgi:hypothetical protein